MSLAQRIGQEFKTLRDNELTLKFDKANIENILTSISTTNALSAAQGKVLKDSIDSISALLSSNDVDLDTLQEIVAFIKANKGTLDSLGIASIIGLQTALNSKVDDSQVLTDVPSGAVFTDTTYSVGDGGLTEKNFTTVLKDKLDAITGTNTGDQDLSGYSLTSHNHTGMYEPADATILKVADVGTTVQGYNANTTTAGNTFNGNSQLVQTTVDGKLPVIDGSLLTGINAIGSSTQINTPIITSPTSGTINYMGAVTATYSTADTYVGAQDYVKWEAGNNDFSTIYDSYEGSNNLTSWTPSIGLPLTTVYVRVTHGSDNHRSVVSSAINFTTPNISIATPTITSPIDGAIDVSLIPTIVSSAYSIIGSSETHFSTDWEIATDSGFTTIVKSSLADIVNLTSWTPTALNDVTSYYVRARHKSANYTSNWSASVHFTTVDIYVQTPTLTVTGTPTDVPETPTLTTSAFSVNGGTDTHALTSWYIKQGGTTVWSRVADTVNKLSIIVPAGILSVSTAYTFEAVHTGTTYGNSGPTINTGTTKASFSKQYGLQWNNTADTYTRLGAAVGWTTGASFTNNQTVQSLMRRCVLNANGTVNYYLSATDSTKKKDGVTAADLTGASGNVMVEIPKFWVKYNDTTNAKQMWISTAPAIGYVVHPAFVKNGVEVDYRYYRAYTGSVSGTKLISRSGVAAARNETLAAFRTKAKANGTGWGLVDWHLLFAVQTLLFIEIGTFNSQAVLGNGNDTGSDYGMTTGGSNSIGNASSPATNDDTWMSYRGIENFYADISEWIDGVNISERLVYTSNTQSTFASDVFSGVYTSTGVTLPSSGYISDMNFSTKGFIPTTSGGSDSTYVTDYVLSYTGARVASFGGAAGYGLLCGAAFLIADEYSSYTDAHFGAGLSF